MRRINHDKWVYLFWDERLDPSQSEEFKKHLVKCGECQKKLAFLESMEGKAKEIHAKELPQEYWDSFSSRIRERIISQKESAPVSGLKKFLENIFVISPWKIRAAAGVVSIVLVFIIGKLYMDYRGKEIVPSGSVSRGVKEQPLRTIEIEKKETTPKGETQGKTKTPVDKTKRIPESVVADRVMEKSTAREIKASQKPTLLKEQEIPPPPSPAPQAEAITPDAAKQEVPKETPTVAGAGGEKKIERRNVETISSRVETIRKGTKIQDTLATEKGIISKDYGYVTKPSYLHAPSADVIPLQEKSIPRIKDTDTLMQADELKNIIQTWKDHFKDNPADSVNNLGYLQVATAYLLLGRLSTDSTVINQGSYLIEEYMKRTKDPAIKDQLSDKLEKVKALGKK